MELVRSILNYLFHGLSKITPLNEYLKTLRPSTSA